MPLHKSRIRTALTYSAWSFALLYLFMLPACSQQESGTQEMAADPITLKDTSVVIYHEVGERFLNTEYFDLMGDAERAALGFIVTRVGNGCWWADEEDGMDSGVTEGKNGTYIDLSVQQKPYSYRTMKCEILWEMGLGLQCSNKHLGFLRHWFRTDENALTYLTYDNCPRIPETATTQSAFDRIDMMIGGDTIIVTSIISFFSFFDGNGTRLRREAQFFLRNNTLTMLKYEDIVIGAFDSSIGSASEDEEEG